MMNEKERDENEMVTLIPGRREKGRAFPGKEFPPRQTQFGLRTDSSPGERQAVAVTLIRSAEDSSAAQEHKEVGNGTYRLVALIKCTSTNTRKTTEQGSATDCRLQLRVDAARNTREYRSSGNSYSTTHGRSS